MLASKSFWRFDFAQASCTVLRFPQRARDAAPVSSQVAAGAGLISTPGGSRNQAVEAVDQSPTPA